MSPRYTHTTHTRQREGQRRERMKQGRYGWTSLTDEDEPHPPMLPTASHTHTRRYPLTQLPGHVSNNNTHTYSNVFKRPNQGREDRQARTGDRQARDNCQTRQGSNPQEPTHKSLQPKHKSRGRRGKEREGMTTSDKAQAPTQQHAAYTHLTYAQPPRPPSPTILLTLKKRYRRK
jgi:hypothetical protein